MVYVYNFFVFFDQVKYIGCVAKCLTEGS